MSNDEFKPIGHCQNSMLAAYQARISLQRQLLKQIQGMLPSHLAEHLLHCVVSVTSKCLLYTDEEEWAAQLRLYLPVVLHSLKASTLPKLELIEVKVITYPAAPKIERKVNLPSKRNIELIRDNLQSIKDEELKQALSRLSETLERLS